MNDYTDLTVRGPISHDPWVVCLFLSSEENVTPGENNGTSDRTRKYVLHACDFLVSKKSKNKPDGHRIIDKVAENTGMHISSSDVSIVFRRDTLDFYPLYYVCSDSCIAFSRSIKSLLPFVSVRRLSHEGLTDWLILQNAGHRPYTLFDGIRTLRQGEEMRILPGKKASYEVEWVANNERPSLFGNVEDLAKSLEGLLLKSIASAAVEHQVRGLMSGGLDSTLLQALASKKQWVRQEAITASFDLPGFDETAGIQAMAQAFKKLQIHRCSIRSPEFAKDIEDLHFCLETPTWSCGSYIQYALYRQAHSMGWEIVLDGTGADALFAGHLPHKDQYTMHLIKTGQILAFSRQLHLRELKRIAKSFAKYCLFPRLNRHLREKLSRWYWHDLRYIKRDFLHAYFDEVDVGIKPFCGEPTSMMDAALLRGDTAHLRQFPFKCASHFKMKSYAPFIDEQTVVQIARSIPVTELFGDGMPKSFLRQYFGKFLPAALIAKRDKNPMRSPNNEWITMYKKEWQPYIFDSGLSTIFHLDLLEKDYDHFFTISGQPETYRHFKFFSLGVWKTVFGVV